jgi:hypothetical protein
VGEKLDETNDGFLNVYREITFARHVFERTRKHSIFSIIFFHPSSMT